MTRVPVLMLVATLGTATGIGLLWSAATLARPTPLESLRTAAERNAVAEAVGDFYAAANDSLRTGNMTALERAVAAGFVDHQSALPAASGVVGYGQVLTALRSHCPGCVLSVDTLVIEGDRAVAEVSLRDSGREAFLGLPREGPWVTWSGHDVLRIADGRIAELWSQGHYAAGTEPLFEDVLLNVPSGLGVFRATHLTLLPGAVLSDSVAPNGAHLLVESGALTVRTRAMGEPRSEEESVIVGPGERLHLAPGVGYGLRNDGAFPVEAFTVAIHPLDDRGRVVESTIADSRANPVGVSRQLLASAVVADQPGGQVALTLGRATLGPGGGIAAHTVGGTEIVAVAVGTAVITCVGSDACATLALKSPERRDPEQGDRRGEQRQTEVAAEAPASVIIRGGRVYSVRNGGDRQVGLVVLLLASTDPSPAAW